MNNLPKNLLILIWLTSAIRSTQGMYGYDCGEQLSNLTTISLIDIGDCDIKPPYINISKTYSQLLQLNDFGVTQIFKCSVKITRMVTHCGMHSHISRVNNGEISYYKDLSQEECARLQKTGYIVIAKMQILGIQRNSTTQKSVTFAGGSNGEGGCTGGSYADPYGQYKDVYVAGWIEIKIEDYYAEVHLETNKIKLHSGAICTLSDTHCIDMDAGYVFWTPLPHEDCGTNKYSVLYEGHMDRIIEAEKGKIMYTLETNDITFALWTIGDTKVCGFTLARTEHPKLFILEDARKNEFLKKTPPATANLDIFAYVNSKFLYVEKHVRRQISNMYYDILQNKCELEKQIITTALSLASTAPEEVGYRIMKAPGYLAVTAGEVIHLLKCLRVEVTGRETEECYDQLPVFRGKEPYFLSPRTRILLRTARQIYCDHRLPPMYKINGVWFKMLPKAVEVKDPEILRPQTKPTWTYVSPETLAVSGVYSQKDTNRLRDMILFPMERNMVLNQVALGMSGREINPEGLTITNLFDQKTITALAETTWNRMWGNFLAFGTASAGIIGVIIICRFIKLAGDTIIHGYALYSLYGFSIYLIGAIWNSVTQLLLHLGHKNRQETKRSENDVEQNNTETTNNRETEENIYPQLPKEPLAKKYSL